MTPRILFVDHTGVLGGGEALLLDVARHYRATSRVVLFEDGPFRVALDGAGVATEVVPMHRGVRRVSRQGRLGQDVRALPGVLRLARTLARQRRGYDLLYANTQKAMIIAALAGALARRPVVWHLHDMMTADHFSAFHCRLAVLLANRLIVRVIANSEATRQAFIDRGGRAEKIGVVYNGFEPSVFEDVSRMEVEALRAGLGLHGVPVVGLFGRFTHWKGQHVLVRALEALPGIHAMLVGDALFGVDTAYAAELRALVRQLGLEERVHFLGFRSDVPALLQLADVVVHTSVAPEPFGRVIVEGMLARRPVVAVRAGGALEIVDHGRTGLLVPPDDPAALAGAVRGLLEHPSEAQALAERGHEEAVRCFALPVILEALEQQLGYVVGAAKPEKVRVPELA